MEKNQLETVLLGDFSVMFIAPEKTISVIIEKLVYENFEIDYYDKSKAAIDNFTKKFYDILVISKVRTNCSLENFFKSFERKISTEYKYKYIIVMTRDEEDILDEHLKKLGVNALIHEETAVKELEKNFAEVDFF